MQILMVTQAMEAGGAETHVIELCRRLAAGPEPYEITVVSAGGSLVSRLEAAGVRHVTLPVNRKDPASVIRARRALGRLLDEGRFDAVHAHARIPAFLLFPLCRRRSLPLYTTCHFGFRTTPLLRRLTRWGDAVLAVSPDLGDYLTAEYGVSPRRIFFCRNGVDTERFCPEERRSEASGRPFGLLTVSRLDPVASAAAEAALRILPRLDGLFPGITLTVVGGGRQSGELGARAAAVNRALGREAAVLTGALEDPLPRYREADLFLGVSRSALEAASVGLPVILAGGEGYGGIADGALWAREARTNWCCRGGSPIQDEVLLRDVTALLSDPGRRAAVAEAGRAFVGENCSLERMAEDYRRFFASAHPRLSAARPDVVISGYYGFGNRGDEAILRSVVDGIHELRPDLTVGVPARAPKRLSEEALVTGIGRLGAFRAAGRARLVISGGGTLLQDRTSLRSLLYYAGVLRAGRQGGAKTAIFASGIGPIGTALGRAAARRAAEHADSISVRDGQSAEALEALGVPAGRITVTADQALRTAYPAREAGSAVALCPKGGQGGVSARRWAKALAGCGHQVILIPLHPKDRRKCGRIARRLPGSRIGDVTVGAGGEVLFPAEVGTVVSERLHGVIFASAAGLPAVAVGSDPKKGGFCRAAGLGDALLPQAVGPDVLGYARRADSERMRVLAAAAARDMERVLEGVM